MLRLFHDRTASGFEAGLLTDPLYKVRAKPYERISITRHQGVDLSNFLREGVDFREYLAIHVMLRRYEFCWVTKT